MLKSIIKVKSHTMAKQYRSLPTHKYKHKNNTYQTPYKSFGTTNVTRNPTLSLYSFTSKKKTNSKNHSTALSSKNTVTKYKNSMVKKDSSKRKNKSQSKSKQLMNKT